MNISIKELKTERQWRSATGYNKKCFTNLLNLFTREHFRIFGKTLSDRRFDSPKESVVETEEELLFLTLLGLKSNLTHDLLGLMVGMDGFNAFRNNPLLWYFKELILIIIDLNCNYKVTFVSLCRSVSTTLA